MKKGMCRGCDNLIKAVQIQFYKKSDPFHQLKKPRRVMKNYCSGIWGFGIHIEYVDRIIDGDQICPKYRKDGIT